MHTTTSTSQASVRELIRGTVDDFKTFIQNEIQLLKAELSEKSSRLGKNAAALAVGGCVAYAGLIVFLAGVGYLLSYAFEETGMSPKLADFLGWVIIGLLGIVMGGIFVFKGLRTISREQLAPQKTLHTLKELKPEPPLTARAGTSQAYHPLNQPVESQGHSSEELEANVLATEQRMGEKLQEIQWRVSPQHVQQQLSHKYHSHPYRWNLVALGTGLVGGVVMKWKMMRNGRH